MIDTVAVNPQGVYESGSTPSLEARSAGLMINPKAKGDWRRANAQWGVMFPSTSCLTGAGTCLRDGNARSRDKSLEIHDDDDDRDWRKDTQHHREVDEELYAWLTGSDDVSSRWSRDTTGCPKAGNCTNRVEHLLD